MSNRQMVNKKFFKVLLSSFSILMLICFIFVSISKAQNWQPLPPYNTLWPLWSPVLSPVDDVTGLAVPVITSLAAGTVLPVEPGLTWDPSVDYPWLLYNTPVGMAYFDPIYGVNYWPPSNLLDADGAPIPILLPDLYEDLAPTDPLWLQQNVLFANSYFLQGYPSLLATADPQLFATATPYPLPPNIITALTLGLNVPTLGTTLYPPPGILDLLGPAALLGW